MRLGYFLIVAAATFLVSCDAVTAAMPSEQTKLSTTTAADSAPVSSSRFLRSARTEEEDDESEEEDSEERMNPLKDVKVPSHLAYAFLAPEKKVVAAAKAADMSTKLAKADKAILTKLQTIDGGLERFAQWKVNGYTPKHVKEILTQANAKKGSPEWETYLQYLAVYVRQHHKVT